MSDKLDEIAERALSAARLSKKHNMKWLRAALDEAVAEERKALREIVEMAIVANPLGLGAQGMSWNDACGYVLAALDARSKP